MSSGKSFCKINKIKSFNKMDNTYGHNYRTFNVPNADPNKSYLNREFISEAWGKDYRQLFEESIQENEIEKIRKNAVLAFEIVLAVPVQDVGNIDINTWAEDNVKWLMDNFNTPGHQNVKSVVLHRDESEMDEHGSCHIHAFVVPIDEKGHLNASYFTDGVLKLKKLQKSYGDLMYEKHGIMPRIEGSKAKVEEMNRFQAKVQKASNFTLEPVQPHETAQEVWERANTEIQDAKLTVLAQERRTQSYISEFTAKEIQQKKILQRDLGQLYEKEKRAEHILEHSLDNEKGLMKLAKKAKQIDNILTGLKHYPDQQAALELKQKMEEMMSYGRKWKSKKKQKEFDEIKKEAQNEELLDAQDAFYDNLKEEDVEL